MLRPQVLRLSIELTLQLTLLFLNLLSVSLFGLIEFPLGFLQLPPSLIEFSLNLATPQLLATQPTPQTINLPITKSKLFGILFIVGEEGMVLFSEYLVFDLEVFRFVEAHPRITEFILELP